MPCVNAGICIRFLGGQNDLLPKGKSGTKVTIPKISRLAIAMKLVIKEIVRNID